ncbi:hypothetical protein [Novosphingobium sp. PASSN1]|uniref:hypothetical protein n=1 Tax=Novosphingobium sp. PASSN1 TaxID=2015561 RepID=UPI000BDA886A|nr:hypothetical protein [Novosphingobium sp. PASSN1]OYU35927.1 MAG: hypothetical protein CFE35_06490 [Novosphingobium sp. PASSN1]
MGGSSFDTPCRIEIEQTPEHFHAHVRLAGDIELQPGDRVKVHGAPIRVDFGQSMAIDRMATVTRASLPVRLWIKLAAYFDLTELYEVSFTPGRPS